MAAPPAYPVAVPVRLLVLKRMLGQVNPGLVQGRIYRKKVNDSARKTLISTVTYLRLLYNLLYLKTDVNVPSVCDVQDSFKRYGFEHW
jgi:hypothetical protein